MHFYRGNIRRKRRMLKLQRSPRGSFFSYIFVNKITNSLKNAKPKSQVIAFYPLKLSRRSSIPAGQTLYSGPQVSRLHRSLTPQVNCGCSDVAAESRPARLRRAFHKRNAPGRFAVENTCRPDPIFRPAGFALSSEPDAAGERRHGYGDLAAKLRSA